MSSVPGTSELIIQDGHFTWRHTNEEEEEGKKEQGTDQGESASTCTIGGLSNINVCVQQVNGVKDGHSLSVPRYVSYSVM